MVHNKSVAENDKNEEITITEWEYFYFLNFLTKEVKEIFQGDCFPIMS